jgi:cation transporter-like permease
MKKLKKQLEELRQLERKKYHPIKTRIRKEHGLSKKTLFYVKEYGPHSNISKTIIKESVKILLLASLLSSFGGLMIEHIKTIFISIVPLIVLLPALNDMLGDYGIIMSSRFTTLLYTGKIRCKWYKNIELRKLLLQIFIIAILTALISSSVALVISSFSGYGLTYGIAYKIFLITIIDTILIVGLLFLISIFAGFYISKKNEDPDNFLIPITTSVADFGNMVLLTLLVILFF